MTPEPQFYIEYAVDGESGRHTVIGRCGTKVINLGDVFTQSFVEAGSAAVEDELGVPRARLEERSIELRVVEIRAYERLLPQIGEGMTGSLALEGTGAGYASAGRVLSGVLTSAEFEKARRRDHAGGVDRVQTTS